MSPARQVICFSTFSLKNSRLCFSASRTFNTALSLSRTFNTGSALGWHFVFQFHRATGDLLRGRSSGRTTGCSALLPNILWKPRLSSTGEACRFQFHRATGDLFRDRSRGRTTGCSALFPTILWKPWLSSTGEAFHCEEKLMRARQAANPSRVSVLPNVRGPTPAPKKPASKSYCTQDSCKAISRFANRD